MKFTTIVSVALCQYLFFAQAQGAALPTTASGFDFASLTLSGFPSDAPSGFPSGVPSGFPSGAPHHKHNGTEHHKFLHKGNATEPKGGKGHGGNSTHAHHLPPQGKGNGTHHGPGGRGNGTHHHGPHGNGNGTHHHGPHGKGNGTEQENVPFLSKFSAEASHSAGLTSIAVETASATA